MCIVFILDIDICIVFSFFWILTWISNCDQMMKILNGSVFSAFQCELKLLFNLHFTLSLLLVALIIISIFNPFILNKTSVLLTSPLHYSLFLCYLK